MFHVDMRMGASIVREYNLSDQRLYVRILAPLLADRDFAIEGHDFTPRKTRIMIYEGPELQPHQLAMGRGWQNVERTSTDVTQAILAKARERTPAAPASGSTTALRERLIGRLSAGPARFEEILAIAAELMPGSSAAEQLAASERVALELLSTGGAQLTR